MKVAIAIDSFKGSIGSVDAGNAAADGVRRVFPSAECFVSPLADGGEGLVDALAPALGGDVRTVEVTGPTGERVPARYALVNGETAIVEMSQAAGIVLVPKDSRNPFATTTFGVGELVVHAAKAGARKFLVGLGGSATNDAGAGMLQALGFRILDAEGREIGSGGKELLRAAKVECPEETRKMLSGLEFTVACDVTNPLCGPSGASAVFGPQKGATPEMVKTLDAALANFAAVSGGDREAPGAGAAGGMGYALKTFFGARLVPGVDLVLEATGFAERVKEADLVITGEGRLDFQTSMGKAPAGVAKLALRYGKKTIAICGAEGEGAKAVHDAGIIAYFPVLRKVTTLEEAMAPEAAAENIRSTVEEVFRIVGDRVLSP